MTARRWFALAAVAYLASLVVAAVLLPDRVPIHFGVSGDADRWAGRPTALVSFAALGLFLALLFALLRPRPPASRDDMGVIGAATLGLLTALVLCTVRAARADLPRLDGVFLGVVVAYLVFVVAWAIRLRRRRPTTIDG
ncbi:DUF1648 domain-containing protein [Nocardioides sp. LML1-1-1.1]|uniref:DUF1648 domain-containing protein n=1 Tax=Nocardioides sp. LML1-1-1.1 TaxID=3135248 RepID=UPI0034122CB6